MWLLSQRCPSTTSKSEGVKKKPFNWTRNNDVRRELLGFVLMSFDCVTQAIIIRVGMPIVFFIALLLFNKPRIKRNYIRTHYAP